MASKQEQPNMGHRHSLTIETNPLHLLPSNIRRFSQADTMRHPAAPILSKLKMTAAAEIPENDADKKADDKGDDK